MKKTIYLIPGVGADETIFKNLELPEQYEVVHIKWEKPGEREPLKKYVKRLLPQIKKDTLPILIGQSFGGIVAIELSKLIDTFRVILISSIKTYKERPYKISLLNLLKFYRLMPAKLLAKSTFWHRWAFGHLKREEKELVSRLVENIDLEFNEWAVDQAIHWKNTDFPKNIIHIHGDRDTIFPDLYIKNYHKIKGGTHFMVVNKAREISHIIHEELEKAELEEQIKTKKEKERKKKRDTGKKQTA